MHFLPPFKLLMPRVQHALCLCHLRMKSHLILLIRLLNSNSTEMNSCLCNPSSFVSPLFFTTLLYPLSFDLLCPSSFWNMSSPNAPHDQDDLYHPMTQEQDICVLPQFDGRTLTYCSLALSTYPRTQLRD